jgi:hypothetical protein
MSAIFLKETMKVVAQHDPFIGKMVNLMEAANGKPRQSGLTLLLQRSDYLTHVEPHGSKMPIGIKQVCITVESTFNEICTRVGANDF